MSTTPKMKTIKKEIQFPLEKLKEILISHLYATSYLDDDDEVIDLEFKSGVDVKNKIKMNLKINKVRTEEQLILIEE